MGIGEGSRVTNETYTMKLALACIVMNLNNSGGAPYWQTSTIRSHDARPADDDGQGVQKEHTQLTVLIRFRVGVPRSNRWSQAVVCRDALGEMNCRDNYSQWTSK